MIYSQWITRTGNNLDLQLVSEVQGAGGWIIRSKVGWSEAQAINLDLWLASDVGCGGCLVGLSS